MQTTTVVFRVWKNGDVIALFPLENADMDNGNICASYSHCGQHGGADYDGVINHTRIAFPVEYAALKAELERLGYKLKVRQKAPANAIDLRHAAVDQFWRKRQLAQVKAEDERRRNPSEPERLARWNDMVESTKQATN